MRCTLLLLWQQETCLARVSLALHRKRRCWPSAPQYFPALLPFVYYIYISVEQVLALDRGGGSHKLIQHLSLCSNLASSSTVCVIRRALNNKSALLLPLHCSHDAGGQCLGVTIGCLWPIHRAAGLHRTTCSFAVYSLF